MITKYKDGAFCFFRNNNVAELDAETIRQLAIQHNIDEVIIPEYAGDRMALSRAIQQSHYSVSKTGYRLEPIIRGKGGKAVWGVIELNKDVSTESLNPNFASKVIWNGDSPDHVTGDHSVVNIIDEEYQYYRNKICGTDWVTTIVDYLQSKCNASPMRDDGRVYWIPPQKLDEVKKLKSFLSLIGISVVLCEIEAENREVVKEAAGDSLANKLADLKIEAENFSGGEKPSTYIKRLEEYQRLRGKALTYKAALGIATDTIEETLKTLEVNVNKLLDIRQTTTIHHDGRVTLKGV
jgi:hypothetical protein